MNLKYLIQSINKLATFMKHGDLLVTVQAIGSAWHLCMFKCIYDGYFKRFGDGVPVEFIFESKTIRIDKHVRIDIEILDCSIECLITVLDDL